MVNKMGFNELSKKASDAIDELNIFIDEDGSNNVLESIKQQMIFIRDKADEEKNPLNELGVDKKFTYGILASREFASPRELELQEYIYSVSREMDKL